MWFSGFFSHSWGVPTMKITDLSILCKWENLKNRQCIKYLFSPLYIYIYIYLISKHTTQRQRQKSSWMVSVSVSAVVINDPSLLTVMLPLSHRCTRPQVNTHKVCNCRLCATLRKYVSLSWYVKKSLSGSFNIRRGYDSFNKELCWEPHQEFTY